MSKKDSKKELEDLQKKAEELEDKYKRTLADYQNLEKRTQNEKKEWVKIANKELLLRLLPALDTLVLVQKHVKDEGLNLSVRQFFDILRQEGVQKIETKGQEFNPKLMECVDTVEGEENKVVDEVSSGFMLFDNVMRPARVKVGTNKKQEKEESPNETLDKSLESGL